jgi:hypothetical protein
MTAGIRVVGDHGYTQLDSDTPVLSLRTKGVAVTGGIQPPFDGGSDVSYSLASIPYVPGDVVAIRSGSPVAYWGQDINGNGILAAYGTGGATIEWWSYCRHIDSGINLGLRLFDGAGSLIYDTGRPIMRVVGDVQGQGTFNIGGAKYAVVTRNLYAQKQVYQQDYNGFWRLFMEAYGAFIWATGSGFQVAHVNFASAAFTGDLGRTEDPGYDPSRISYYGGTRDSEFTVINVTGQ